MPCKLWFRTFSLLLISLLATSILPGQTEKINLFTDCDCDQNYIRQALPYVNHVRDQGLSDVQLFVYDIRLGSGGRSYTLSFKGRNDFQDLDQELLYETGPTATNDDVRKGLARKIAVGLLPYLVQTDMVDLIQYSVQSEEEETADAITPTDDPWNNWIFEIRGEGEINKETSRSGIDLEFGFEGDRVTDDWRIRTDAEMNYAQSEFRGENEEFLSKRQRHYIRASVVHSLGNHWSAGVFSGIQHNTYNNLNYAYFLHPAIEYNIYPYREVLRREIVFAYRIGFFQNDYIQTTIFDQNREFIPNHTLNVQTRFRQPWGDIYANLELSTFLQDFSKNRVEFYSRVSVRVFKGLAVQFSANLDLIRDQINLPAGEASIEDILLRQRQIATSFELYTGVGLSYTFGSAFNNIVNTRL
ncbi:DUF481 domain-containing protein [Flavilitoribacter nigricans]|uniref:DUF481 domain-containing protein n=1 Tax=Flavilitoribacter nigricans (strain ATCC 23147 / DSM 23189 / NBRC 102662 / NCIMB 1420 / SS-2) TaxID=1122177 RepID=A0A2D0N8K3_FLAN2|nr:DUF481 domain-containing protein [Flavilitoribacter nigricans]PHN04841.1 hypothetical protein CRP01_20235 [Flavilitoribacter nigricans DSM 23189 = NBRC 102662]